ncbi:uncharacterized protein LOC142348426 [Convolutriloba macropyga]|uniref:uncharacterized protein LOC142348426 n=1 Tax=Convolutriloba macropyga TaxID=536237 RepID=UPI003F520BD5
MWWLVSGFMILTTLVPTVGDLIDKCLFLTSEECDNVVVYARKLITGEDFCTNWSIIAAIQECRMDPEVEMYKHCLRNHCDFHKKVNKTKRHWLKCENHCFETYDNEVRIITEDDDEFFGKMRSKFKKCRDACGDKHCHDPGGCQTISLKSKSLVVYPRDVTLILAILAITLFS